MGTTARLKEARTFLHDLLVEWNHGVLDAQQMKALPHFTVILDAMMPVEVEDAHLERAKEVEAEMVSTSTAEPGQQHPPGHAIKIMATAIAGAEVRGLLKSGDLLETAWGIIANASGGDWDAASPEWKAAAERWRDQYHKAIRS